MVMRMVMMVMMMVAKAFPLDSFFGLKMIKPIHFVELLIFFLRIRLHHVIQDAQLITLKGRLQKNEL